MNRIPVPEPAELRTDARELITLVAPPGREAPRTMTMLARQPDLLAPFLGWAAALALHGVLPKRERELVALRIARNCGSDFEWGEHAEYARAAGLTENEITRIATSTLDASWAAGDLALLHAADELTAGSSITDTLNAGARSVSCGRVRRVGRR